MHSAGAFFSSAARPSNPRDQQHRTPQSPCPEALAESHRLYFSWPYVFPKNRVHRTAHNTKLLTGSPTRRHSRFEVFNQALQSPPPTGTHWSLRSLAEHIEISKSTVACWFQLSGVRPHRQKHFKLSNDPFVWTATADSILEKVQRLCKLVSGTRH